MDCCTISLLFYAAPPVLSFDALPFPRPQIWSFCRGGDDTIFGGNDLGDSRAAAAAGAGARHRVPAGWAGGARQPAIWGRATLAAPA